MYLQLNSQVIYYEIRGDGQKSLLMLHGNGESHEIFDKLCDALSEDFSICLMDTRGHGLSEKPSEYHYADMAEDVLLLIDFLSLQQPAVLGFSDGAIIALICAIKCPNIFSHLILCGANLSPKGLKWRATMEIKRNYLSTRDPLQKLMLTEPNIPPKDLQKIASPTLVVAGEKDLVKESETSQIAAALPNANMRILPGETHDSYVVHSDKLASKIRVFLN